MTQAVIVTRAEPGAAETAERVRSLGFKAIVSPALSLEAIAPAPPIDAERYDGLIFTSANGVRFFAAANEHRTAAWCVGPATQQAAEQAGFKTIHNANGDSGDLHDLILNTCDETHRLLHVANEAAAGNLVSRLCAAGREVSFTALYRTQPASALTQEAMAALETGALVLIHSAKGARGFLEAKRGAALNAVRFVAVSKAASEPLICQGARQIICASRPNEAALMTALETTALFL